MDICFCTAWILSRRGKLDLLIGLPVIGNIAYTRDAVGKLVEGGPVRPMMDDNWIRVLNSEDLDSRIKILHSKK